MPKKNKSVKKDGKFIQLTSMLIINDKKKQLRILSKMKKEYSDAELNFYISKLSKHPIIHKFMRAIAFPKSINLLGNNDAIRDSTSLERQLYYTAITVKNYSDEISNFIRLKKIYERSILVGDYASALKTIDTIEADFGFSVWAIENRIALLELTSGLEKEKEFSNKILSDKSISIVVRLLVSYFSMRSEKNVSYSWYSSSLNDAINESLEEKLQQYLIFKLNPFYKHEYSCLEDLIEIDDVFSVIDQYLTFIRISQYLILTTKDNSIINSVVKAVKIINNKIEDPRLTSILAIANQEIVRENDQNEKELLNALDAYTLGEYKECILICEGLFKNSPEYVELYEVYLKSLFKINQEYLKRDNLFGRILLSLNEILQKTNRANESYQDLMKLITVFASNTWAIQLYGLVNKLYHYESKDRNANDNISILNSNASNPMISLLCNNDNYFEQFDENQSHSVTLSLYRALFQNSVEELKSINLPVSRFLKYAGTIERNTNDYDNAKQKYQLLFENQEDILQKQDSFVGLIRCYIDTQEFLPCLELIVDILFKYQNLYVIVPFEKLLDEIEAVGIDQVPISLPIVYDMYSKYNSNNKDSYKFEAYEDYLSSKDVEKPSELEKILETEDVSEIIYFLKNICTVDIMKYSTIFPKLEDVERERIYVYQLLSKLDPDNKKKYLEEIKNYTQQMIIRKGIRQIEENKIHVDTEGIKRSLEKSLLEKYQRYNALRDVDSETTDYITVYSFELNENDDLLSVMASNEKENLLQMIILELRDAFVSSNAYGLNGYLSMGFRHGTVSGQLRRFLIAEHLITPKKNQTNIYHVNEYWNDIYQEILPGSKGKLKDLLDNFSRGVDEIINSVVNEWIQIKTEKSSGKGMFDFQFIIDDLEEIQRELQKDNTYSKFIDIVFMKLWNMTDNSLIRIKERIEIELKPKFNTMFEELQMGIDRLKIDTNFSEIKNSITRARTATQHELDRISTWFNRSNKFDVADYNVNLSIDIAIAIVQYTHPNKTINVEVTTDITKKLRGKTLKAFVDIFYTVLDNAVTYPLIDEPKVTIDFNFLGGLLTITCENDLSNDFNVTEARDKLDNIKDNINSDFSLDKVSDEGGTGLYKIMKILNIDLISPSKLAYSFTDKSSFILIISIGKGEGLFI